MSERERESEGQTIDLVRVTGKCGRQAGRAGGWAGGRADERAPALAQLEKKEKKKIFFGAKNLDLLQNHFKILARLASEPTVLLI